MSSIPHSSPFGNLDPTANPANHTSGFTSPSHAMKWKIDVQLPPARDAPPPPLHVMGYSRWRRRITVSALSLPSTELNSFLDRLRLHQKSMRRPLPGRFGGPSAEFFRTLASLTSSRAIVFHTAKACEERAFQQAMAWIAGRLIEGASALVLMRTSGGPVWYHLTRGRTALLPHNSPLLAGLPCSETDALLAVDLARDHAWASHHYRNRPDTTNDPRRPSSPPPGAESPETL